MNQKYTQLRHVLMTSIHLIITQKNVNFFIYLIPLFTYMLHNFVSLYFLHPSPLILLYFPLVQWPVTYTKEIVPLWQFSCEG